MSPRAAAAAAGRKQAEEEEEEEEEVLQVMGRVAEAEAGPTAIATATSVATAITAAEGAGAVFAFFSTRPRVVDKETVAASGMSGARLPAAVHFLRRGAVDRTGIKTSTEGEGRGAGGRFRPKRFFFSLLFFQFPGAKIVAGDFLRF